MKQPKKSKSRENTVALYFRLSDDKKEESNSIENQDKLLTDIAKKMGFTNILRFADDDISGTQRNRENRKAFHRMIEELEKGYISTVMVKDLSRLARDHLLADTLIEEWLPERDIRLVAPLDGVDTANGEDDFITLRNWMNEMYAKDISRKRKATNVVKANEGIPISLPPYGYMKNPDNPKFWVIDPEAAEVVRRIYDMNLNGKGTDQIASVLTEERILTPLFYWKSKGLNRPGKVADRESHEWNNSSVIKILTMQEYCGDVINLKTHSKTFRNKKRYKNKKEDMKIVLDAHEAVIERAIWEKVQRKRGKIRKRTQKNGERSIFSGLLCCADCGGNMNFHFNQKNPEIEYFNCSNNNKSRKTCPETHYVRVDFLEGVILGEIRRLSKFAKRYEKEFAEFVMGQSQQAADDELGRKKKELSAMKARDRELDRLYESLYESNMSGKISDERFVKMSRSYEQEQSELAGKIKALAAELDNATDTVITAEMFLSTVRKYTRAKKLTHRMLSEIVERVEVHHAEKVDGVHVQRLSIHYQCVGEVVIPEALLLPAPEVQVQTRKGVTVAYCSGKKDESA